MKTINKHLMQTMKRGALVAAVSTALSVSSAHADVIVLDFEGINSTYPSGFATISEFYNGGTSSDGTSGVDYGISFESNAQAICLNTVGTNCSNTSRGGFGDPDSQLGGLFFLAGTETTMNVAAGFDTGFSFFYTAPFQTGSVQVFEGLDATGALLATLDLATTSSSCGNLGGFCPFVAAGVTFDGTARSVAWGGVANQVVFDDVTFGSATPGDDDDVQDVPVSGTLGLVALGLAGLSRTRRRNK